MGEEKIIMRVLREIGYDSFNKAVLYRATVRVLLRMPSGPERDLVSFIHLQALSPEELETEINEFKEEFEKLLKENPEFVKKIRVSEEKEI